MYQSFAKRFIKGVAMILKISASARQLSALEWQHVISSDSHE